MFQRKQCLNGINRHSSTSSSAFLSPSHIQTPSHVHRIRILNTVMLSTVLTSIKKNVMMFVLCRTNRLKLVSNKTMKLQSLRCLDKMTCLHVYCLRYITWPIEAIKHKMRNFCHTSCSKCLQPCTCMTVDIWKTSEQPLHWLAMKDIVIRFKTFCSISRSCQIPQHSSDRNVTYKQLFNC